MENFDRLKAIEEFNNKKQIEKEDKEAMELKKEKELKDKIHSMQSRIDTLLKIARNCKVHKNNYDDSLEKFYSDSVCGYWYEYKQRGLNKIKFEIDCRTEIKYFYNLGWDENYHGDKNVCVLEVGYLKDSNEFQIIPHARYESGQSYTKTLEYFLNNYDEFEKEFYDYVDKFIK